MHSLITGATGFAGSHLAEHLLDRGDRVLGVARRDGWPSNAPPGLRESVPLVLWDVADAGGLTTAARRTIERFAPRVIYHLAAVSVPGHCEDSAARPDAERAAERTNVGGTQNVIELCLALPSRPRLLLVSSSHVYAPGAAGAMLGEESPLGPHRAYGRTKWGAEEAIRAAVRNRGLDAAIARAFQHAGPRQGPELMLSEWARQFVRRASPVRVRNLTTHLDLTDVRDVVRAYRLLAERGARGELYNVGSGRAILSGDVLRLLQTAAGSAAEVEEGEPGERHDPLANVAKLTALTGWRPEIPLARTAADVLAAWRSA